MLGPKLTVSLPPHLAVRSHQISLNLCLLPEQCVCASGVTSVHSRRHTLSLPLFRPCAPTVPPTQ